MAKKVKSVEVSKRDVRARIKVALNFAGVVAFAGAIAYVGRQSRRYADAHGLAPSGPLNVVLIAPPAWMNDELREHVRRIAQPEAAGSSLDASAVNAAAAALAREPWVKRVEQVRRVYGQAAGDTLEVRCEFRTPVALVQEDGWFWMIDGEGVKLPERFLKGELSKVAVGRGDGGMQLRVISGVRNPPPEAGERWPGSDLEAGLELAKLFHDKPYLNDVAIIDVGGIDAPASSNRRRNEVVLHTRYNTQVRWGEPIARAAFSVDVPVGQKLMTLERLYTEYGRVDAGRPWIEIRYDSVLYPTDAETQSATSDGR